MPVYHLDIETFMTALERMVHAEYKKCALVIAPPKARATVLAASPEAKALGLSKGFAVSYVKRHFRDVKIVPPDYALYNRVQKQIFAVAKQFSPVVEPIRYGHVAMDMTGMHLLHGCDEDAAVKIRNTLKDRLSLCATVGIAGNKLVSTIAAKEVQKHNEVLCRVREGDEPRFLAPLVCKALPEWEHPDVRRLLFDLNLRRIEHVQEIPPALLGFTIGAMGVQLYRHAQGIDPRPVCMPGLEPQMEANHHFTPDENDDRCIKGVLFQLCESLCARLRRAGKVCDRIEIRLHYADDVQRSQWFKLAMTQREQEIYAALETRLERFYDRRRRVRGLKLVASGLSPYFCQPSLFGENEGKALSVGMDLIREKFGKNVIQSGRSVQKLP